MPPTATGTPTQTPLPNTPTISPTPTATPDCSLFWVNDFNIGNNGFIDVSITNNSPDIKKFVYDTLTTIKYRYFYESSEFIDNASFIRLKTVTLTYTPQQTFIGNIRWKFSLSLENIITITKYRGYDPEATIFTDNNFSDNAVDKGAYPNPKAFYISVGLTF